MKKARVFISCGQSNEREKSFGNFLLGYFAQKGFDPYFAEEIHDSKPLLLSVLDSLKESEFCVIFNPSRTDTPRIGSLFVQQEIAIAASKRIPTLYFFENGVERTIGMSSGLHLNGIEINNPSELTHHLDLHTRNWDPKSRNQLFLESKWSHLNVQVSDHPQHPLSNWLHVVVLNGSNDEHAKNCRAYVEKIELIAAPQFVTSEYKQELIWAGTGTQSISLTKNSKRDFDAIWTIQGSGEWRFHSFDTSTLYGYPILSDGEYAITYLVVSENFPDARLKIDINLANDTAMIRTEEQL